MQVKRSIYQSFSQQCKVKVFVHVCVCVCYKALNFFRHYLKLNKGVWNCRPVEVSIQCTHVHCTMYIDHIVHQFISEKHSCTLHTGYWGCVHINSELSGAQLQTVACIHAQCTFDALCIWDGTSCTLSYALPLCNFKKKCLQIAPDLVVFLGH